jgi:predicted acyl esterase
MYMRHQRDGGFWRKPVRPLKDIEVPSFLIGGLVDGYRDSIPAMLEQVTKAPVASADWSHGTTRFRMTRISVPKLSGARTRRDGGTTG